MAKYLLLKHYRGAPEPPNNVPMSEWTPSEVDAHVQYMNDFAARIEATGEFVTSFALSESGAWVRSGGDGQPAVTEGPFPDDRDLVAGGMIIEAATYERALELAAAPGAGGEPIREWLELRPFYGASSSSSSSADGTG
ncbi:hypothetical protein NCCP2495_14280 [Dietzia sp. NCCP-2495]|uniref:YciI family protein n=1 Tax=Dietzia sp. NCCP-2495 TaxID=2934675 RepID=UPI00222E6866|nr:YciI family protein [Dietzia sp. NCCP-2495]GLB63549.1 hypothetical protein NCCP2495_14280 [Dietzia sp. NCCP-2495]